MELRHLRHFLAVAEELNFSRAAERLHIEQSPLSRSIRQLEDGLGVQLFERNSHGTRLTWPGQVFVDEARRVLTTAAQARAAARSAAIGYRGFLRIAVSDGASPRQMSILLAHCREESPETEIRLYEVPFAQQLKGLRDGSYDAGFAKTSSADDDMVTMPIWSEALMVAVPARHPLLAHKALPVTEVLRYPLVLFHPNACEGCHQQLLEILHTSGCELKVAEQVASYDLMMALVAAGYGLGLTTQEQFSVWRYPDVLGRPLAGVPVLVTTYLLHSDRNISPQLREFIDRVRRKGLPTD